MIEISCMGAIIIDGYAHCPTFRCLWERKRTYTETAWRNNTMMAYVERNAYENTITSAGSE